MLADVLLHVAHSVPVAGFSDYSVCSCGQIISFKAKEPRIVKSFPRSRYKHRSVNLCANGKTSMVILARIVAAVFLPSPLAGQSVVMHVDDNPENNSATNLRWGSPADNSADMTSKGRQARGERCASAKLSTETVRTIRSMAASQPQVEIARALGLTTTNVNSIVNRKTWKHVCDRKD